MLTRNSFAVANLLVQSRINIRSNLNISREMDGKSIMVRQCKPYSNQSRWRVIVECKQLCFVEYM